MTCVFGQCCRNFALRSNIKIGNRTLASYTYTDRTNYLSRLDYGNGDSVQYEYDKQGRVTKETYEDGDTVTYKYDNSGALATVTDSATGRTTTYYYDFTDRMMKYVESGTDYSHSVGYEYDNINNLTALVETINGVTRTTSYSYDDDNRVTSVSTGGISESYSYDSYGRVTTKVTKNGSTTILTEHYTYKTNSAGQPTNQVATMRSVSGCRDVTYTYSYDANGNITSVSDGTYTTTYAYDSANQLIRENNQEAGVSLTWRYDDGGNMVYRAGYEYSTGDFGEAEFEWDFQYQDEDWGDLATHYLGYENTYDEIGNILEKENSVLTWEHGRELASMTSMGYLWRYTYDANGMRASRTDGLTTYHYVYNGSSLSQVTVSRYLTRHTLDFTYDASGRPLSLTYDGTPYYYALNLQGDVVAILDGSGNVVVSYVYDAWGSIRSITGSLKDTVGYYNPLRYRGYVWDPETGIYYLESRYYSPGRGRFLNTDTLVSTGQGLLGNNMFAYCQNNPVIYSDNEGNIHRSALKEDCYSFLDGGGSVAPNTEYLMAFYGVDAPGEIPEMPEGAMIFVENITSVSNKIGLSIIEGRTIVMDADKYCEYTFVGIGWSRSLSMPLDRTFSQGYVYGLEDVTDYCGLFLGASANMLSDISGGAIASPKVYAKITGGMSYASSIGGSITWYMTGQSDWIYGRANMVVVTNPYQNSPLNSTPHM